jgi:hypothetical protein
VAAARIAMARYVYDREPARDRPCIDMPEIPSL